MLRCLTCGNEAGQPVEPVESSKGGAYVAPPVYCAQGHPPQAMARLSEAPGMGPGVRRDVLGAPHSEQ